MARVRRARRGFGACTLDRRVGGGTLDGKRQKGFEKVTRDSKGYRVFEKVTRHSKRLKGLEAGAEDGKK